MAHRVAACKALPWKRDGRYAHPQGLAGGEPSGIGEWIKRDIYVCIGVKVSTVAGGTADRHTPEVDPSLGEAMPKLILEHRIFQLRSFE